MILKFVPHHVQKVLNTNNMLLMVNHTYVQTVVDHNMFQLILNNVQLHVQVKLIQYKELVHQNKIVLSISNKLVQQDQTINVSILVHHQLLLKLLKNVLMVTLNQLSQLTVLVKVTIIQLQRRLITKMVMFVLSHVKIHNTKRSYHTVVLTSVLAVV